MLCAKMCCERIERCITAFEDDTFAVQLASDDRTPEDLVAEILSHVSMNSATEQLGAT